MLGDAQILENLGGITVGDRSFTAGLARTSSFYPNPKEVPHDPYP